MNKAVTVLYDCCAGGEFFSWLLAQQVGCSPLQVVMAEANKWNLNPLDQTPEFSHIMYQSDDVIGYEDITYSDTKINVLRDHAEIIVSNNYNKPRHKKLFLKNYYNDWNTAAFIMLHPSTKESTEYMDSLIRKKFGTEPAKGQRRVEATRKRRILAALGDVPILEIDPYTLFFSDTDGELAHLQTFLNDTYGKDAAALDSRTMKFFIEFWKDKNENPFF